MPLQSGKSEAAFKHNVEVEIEAGKPQKQAVAIAYRQRREAKDGNPEVELEEAVEAGEEEARHQKAALEALDVDCAEDEAPSGMAFDRAMSFRSKDINGWLHIRDCRITKANICPYLGREIPGAQQMGLEPEKVYNLYRDADALASATSTFNGIPLMIVHTAVTADQPNKEKIIGCVSNPRWQAPYVVADLTVWDGEGIAAIESGAQEELSPGYHYKPQMNSGVLDGDPYDGRMLEILANHLAIVDTGRTGPDVVVNDSALPQAA